MLSGKKWKEWRAELTPALTQSRIRSVLPVTDSVCKKMLEYIDQQQEKSKNKEIEAIDAEDVRLV